MSAAANNPVELYRQIRPVARNHLLACIRYVLNCIYSVAFSQNYENNLHDKDLIEMLGWNKR